VARKRTPGERPSKGPNLKKRKQPIQGRLLSENRKKKRQKRKVHELGDRQGTKALSRGGLVAKKRPA